MELPVVWPGGRQQVGTAQASMTFGLITGDSDLGEQGSGPGPCSAQESRPPEERGVRGRKKGVGHNGKTQNWPSWAGREGGASATTKARVHQDGLPGLSSADPEGRGDLPGSLSSRTQGVWQSSRGHRKLKGGAGFVVWERLDTEESGRGAESSNTSPRGAAQPGAGAAPAPGLPGFSLTRGRNLLANATRTHRELKNTLET